MIPVTSFHATHAPPASVATGAIPMLDPVEGAMVPAAASVVGGSTPVAVAAILTFFIAVGLSLLVTYRVIEGYRRTRQRPILFLAVGIFLLAPAPMLLRFTLANVAPVGLGIRSLAAAGAELLGLLCILYTVYDR